LFLVTDVGLGGRAGWVASVIEWECVLMRLSMHAVGVGFVTAFVAASSARAQLVINEVDYDQVGTDFNEFIELRNNSNCRIPLADLAIVLVNGTGSAEYQRVSLAGAATFIEPGQYLVVGSASVTSIVPAGVLRVNFPFVGDNMQNGTPDGLALIDTAARTVLDALSYEGGMTAVTIVGFPGTVSLVSGSEVPLAVSDSNIQQGSVIRQPDGKDSGNDAADWRVASTPSPGVSNGGTPAPPNTCCPGDLDDGSTTGARDYAVDINDLLYFLAAFELGHADANLDNGSGSGTPDETVDINDLLFFLVRFEAGC